MLFCEFNQKQKEFINHVLSKTRIGIKREGCIVLNAPAGTGKTTVVKYLYNQIHNVRICAPTHKAKGVLIKGTKMFAHTVHSFLGAEDNYDKDGDIYFEFSRSNEHQNLVIFVDECSMLNDAMVNEFKKISQNNLVIFVGDDLQLPPVVKEEPSEEEERTKVSTISKSFLVNDKWQLTENMRSRAKRSTDMLQLAREACYANRMPDKMPPQSVEAVVKTFIDYQDTDKTCIVLAYTNIKVNEYNKLIRSALFLNDTTSTLNRFYVGEKLMFASGFRMYSKEHKYYSSSIIEICELSKETLSLEYKSCGCKPDEFKRTRCRTHNYARGTIELEFYKIIDQNNVEWYQPVNSNKFAPLAKQYKDICKATGSTAMWRNYYQWIYLYNSDLRYEYASTIHKSQGSEWHTVFVDRNNLTRCASRNSLLKVNGYYTAISRMREEVYDIQ